MPQTNNNQRREKKAYKPHLVRCMNLVKGTSHPKDYNFSDEELFALKPDEIKRYLATLSYGMEQPSATDLPVVGRASSLEYAKKAISYYMPNRNMVWNMQTNQGNPTRSADLNDFIKDVKKKEVRKQGKPSQARRALTEAEFRQVVKYVRRQGNGYTHKYNLAAYYIFQFHMVARVDDVMHFKCEDLTPHLDFDFALKSKMCWSKNLLDERSTSDQIVLGAGDPSYCTLLALAIHLETNTSNGLIHSSECRLFGIDKQIASKRFKAIVEDEDFEKSGGNGELGSHSTRKFAATFARRNGCSRDDVDARGRWKGQRRVVDMYIDSSLPFPDAKVAGSLCIGGPIKYVLRQDSRVSDDWIVENVTPGIAGVFPRSMAVTLGKALLWGICDEEASEYIDESMVQRVRAELRALNGCYTAVNPTNPVKKVPLIIGGEQGALIINEFVTDDAGDDGNSNAATGGATTGLNVNGTNSVQSNQQIRVLVSAVRTLTRQNEEIKNELHLFKSTCNTLLTQLNTSVRRIAIIPTVRVNRRAARESSNTNPTSPTGAAANMVENASSNEPTSTPYESTLTKCPKSLHVIWQEYEFGVGGRKAAKTFNARERGRVKYNYCLRNHFWLLMKRMILRGYSHTSAIDKIYSVYGVHLSATKILREIRKDSKIGGHPQLR